MTARSQRATVTLPLPVHRPDHWTEAAACAKPGTSPLWWDGVNDGEGTPTRRERQARAKDICETCPAATRCKETAATEPQGVWAGRVIGERPERPSRAKKKAA